MSVVKVLSGEQIESIFTIPMAIQAVERAYLEKHIGQGGTWLMVFHEFDPGRADLDIKSGHLGGANTYGLKVVSWFGANPGKGLPALFGTSLLFDLSTGAPKALLNAGVKQADIIFTATPAYEPYIKAGWVRPGTHLSCIGADMSGKEEVDPELFRTARVFGDDEGQCLSVGECEIPHRKGILPGLLGEIGGVMAGAVPGRRAPDEITIFDSTGIALQDLASAAIILETADRENLGTDVEL